MPVLSDPIPSIHVSRKGALRRARRHPWIFCEALLDFFHQRLAAAIELRQRLPLIQPCSAPRLVNADSDGLPGLIADRYSDFLICQFLSAGAEYWKRTIVEQFGRIVAVQGICERSRGEAHSNSCSGLASENLFHQVVAAAALDSDRQVRIIERLGQAADHPVTAVFPQGHYLKGLIGMVRT